MSAENTIRRQSVRTRLQQELPVFLRGQRWFGGKAQPIRAVELMDTIPLDVTAARTYLLLVQVEYQEGLSETYSVPVVEETDAAAIPAGTSGKPTPYLELKDGDTGSVFFYDATASKPFLDSLLKAIRENRRFRGERGELDAVRATVLERLASGNERELTPKLMRAEQSNSSVVYGDRLVLKLFRRVEEGTNPDLEIGWFLTEKTGYQNVPPVAGYLEYKGDDATRMSLGMLQSFVPNQGDAWEFTLRTAARYFERVQLERNHPPEAPRRSLLPLAADAIPQQPQQLIGEYLASARLLGERTAELHLALSSSRGDPAFDPEPYSQLDQRAFCESALGLLRRNLQLLGQQKSSLPVDIRPRAQEVLDSEPELEQRFRRFEDRALTGLRTRIHGDYHLGQVLVSGDDFVLIDFEGEPARPLAYRRRKQSPLQDVAGMLRSFHYAAYAPLLGAGPPVATMSPLTTFEPWAYFWNAWVSAAFLHSYLATARSAPFLSGDSQEVVTILEAHLLEKAVYELGYELNNRPSWVRIPLRGIAQLIESE